MSQTAFALGTFSRGQESPFAGMVIGTDVYPLTAVASFCASTGSPIVRFEDVLALIDVWDEALPALKAAANAASTDNGLLAARTPIAELHTHQPFQPRQVFCSGANYHKHVVDMIMDRFRDSASQGLPEEEQRKQAEDMMHERARTGEPYIFSRIVTSLAGPFDDLVLPSFTAEADWEIELAVVLKHTAQNVTRKDAMAHVLGYMVANDITNRDVTFRKDDMKSLGTDWLQGKNSPGYFPMGPVLVPAEFVPDPHNLRLTLKLNGETMQDEVTSDMIFDIPRQIEVLTKYVKVLPGDVLSTGSPAGNGTHYNRYLQPGDVMEASVEGLGTQRVACVKAN